MRHFDLAKFLDSESHRAYTLQWVQGLSYFRILLDSGAPAMRVMDGKEGAIALRRWRRDAGLSRPAAAADLGISERMLAYYEAGERPIPRAILLAVTALAAGLDESSSITALPRERWVALVEQILAYGQGVPVVGRMLRERDVVGLTDFLTFVKRGPDPSLAMTDPALFMSMRSAVTRAQLAGLARFRIDARDVAAAPRVTNQFAHAHSGM